TYTIDASQALETVRVLKPKNLAPMHYQMGLGNLPISTVDPFLAGIGAEGYAVRQLKQAELVWEDKDQAVCFVFRFGP
ncbi:MAG: MBL fold metallo-hydrolase, partial [Armatimonadetes bacterium]|nr:MBL fold metallo-hydrolase [Armatimonadota bacterium]